MGKYDVNTDELRVAMQQLMTKANEMQAAVDAVESKMAAARAMHAPVVANIVKDWDQLQKGFKQLFQAGTQISHTLKSTASNIDAVMKGG